MQKQVDQLSKQVKDLRSRNLSLQDRVDALEAAAEKKQRASNTPDRPALSVVRLQPAAPGPSALEASPGQAEGLGSLSGSAADGADAKRPVLRNDKGPARLVPGEGSTKGMKKNTVKAPRGRR